MKKITILLLTFLVSGCPGDRLGYQVRGVLFHRDIICFSVDKKETLNFYRVETMRNGVHKIIKARGGLHLSYPDTCFKIKLDRGYEYSVSFGLNGQNYSYNFFINNDGI